MEVACVALVGLVVSIINAAILSGLLQCTLSVICGAIAGNFPSFFAPFFVSGGGSGIPVLLHLDALIIRRVVCAEVVSRL